MTTASELFSDDARVRFTNTKALFEQLERQHEVGLPGTVLYLPPRCPPSTLLVPSDNRLQ